MNELISRAEVMKHMHFRINEDGKTEGYVRTVDILNIPAVEVDSKNVDLIRRQDAIDILTRYRDSWQGDHYVPFQKAIDEVNGLPSAERKGKWIPINKDAPMFSPYVCSVCGAICRDIQDRYCYKCGARMVTDEET